MMERERATINEIAIAYLAAAFTPPAIALAVGIVTGGATPMAMIGFQTLIGAISVLAIMATSIGIVAALPALIAIVWARRNAIHNPLIQMGFTGALSAFLLMVSGVSDTIERGYSTLTYSLLAGGFLAGFVFWTIAGKKL